MTPWIKNLLIANTAVYFFTVSFPILGNMLALQVHPLAVLLRPWTPVTYMFVHASVGHLFFNMLWLFFLGGRVEAKLGSRKFLSLYLLSGLGGVALSFVFARGIAIVGASGAVYGIVLAYAMFWPRESIWIFGILPVQPRALAGFMFVLALLGGFDRVNDGVAHFAHLGGFLGAFLYVRWLERNSPHRKFKELAHAADRRRPGQDSQDMHRWANIRAESLHEVNRDEVERLQAKIRDLGVASLTLDERAFLNRFSALRN